jgi:hypothetical protein
MHRIALPGLSGFRCPLKLPPWKLAGFEIVPLMWPQQEFIEC